LGEKNGKPTHLARRELKRLSKEAEPFTTRVKYMDFSKARRDLNHDPRVPLEEGIPRTTEWTKKAYGLK